MIPDFDAWQDAQVQDRIFGEEPTPPVVKRFKDDDEDYDNGKDLELIDNN